MIGYFKTVLDAALATCRGLGITLRYLFKPAVTVQYPKEKLVPFEKFRGALLFDAELCISCSQCVKACPSSCIDLENATNEAGRKIAKVRWYSIDFAKCNYCRLCEESCPTKPKSIWHSLDYELVFDTRDEMVRLWKKGFNSTGMYWDRRAKEFKGPAGQVPIQLVAARKLY